MSSGDSKRKTFISFQLWFILSLKVLIIRLQFSPYVDIWQQ